MDRFSKGDGAIRQRPLGAAACCPLLQLTCGILMTSSHSQSYVGYHNQSVGETEIDTTVE